jgi:hypothetical protein
MKKVIFWEPKRAEKRKPDGSIVPAEFVGKFRTKVEASTPGAINYAGTLANGKAYDYNGIDVDAISGKLRWIDKQDNGEYGTNLVIFLESDKFLHRISVKYDPYNLKDVMNHLCGLGKDVLTYVINVSYWVRKAKTQDGGFKVNNKGEAVWNKSLSFRDVPVQFTFEQWKEFAQANGLEWTQVKRANGDKEWNSDAEYKYWDGRMVELQRFLLKSGAALPFCYNSMIACEVPNPSGGGNLTADEIALCNSVYERVRADYAFPFGRAEKSADDAFDQVSVAEQQERIEYLEKAKPLPAPGSIKANHDATNEGWPTVDTNNYELVGTPDDSDDLPF